MYSPARGLAPIPAVSINVNCEKLLGCSSSSGSAKQLYEFYVKPPLL
jgi:hypothetical protein